MARSLAWISADATPKGRRRFCKIDKLPGSEETSPGAAGLDSNQSSGGRGPFVGGQKRGLVNQESGFTGRANVFGRNGDIGSSMYQQGLDLSGEPAQIPTGAASVELG